MNSILSRTVFALLLLLMPVLVSAQAVETADSDIVHAQVVEVLNTETELLPPDNIEHTVQTIQVELLEGERRGEIIEFDNDFIQLKAGQKFYMEFVEEPGGMVYYSVHSLDRRAPILFLAGLFVIVLLAFSGRQGLRSLMALTGSVFVILYILVPSLLAGFPPVLTSIVVALAVLFFALFFTHGFNKHTSVAFGGTALAVIATGLLAQLAIMLTSLTGFATDASVYLNFSTGGTLDFRGLLLAGIIIGAIGVLDDIAITQVAVVRELYDTSKTIAHMEVYKRALRVGREHIGALVNTLVLAYTGTALPLLLLFSQSTDGFASIINQEVFATEIVRTLAGSIGLILAVPLTTLLAVYMYYRSEASGSADSSADSTET